MLSFPQSGAFFVMSTGGQARLPDRVSVDVTGETLVFILINGLHAGPGLDGLNSSAQLSYLTVNSKT